MSQAVIDWGDGSATQNVPIVGTLTSWTLTDVAHLYPEGGPYTARVTGPSAGHVDKALNLPMTPSVLGVITNGDAAVATSLTLTRPAEAVNGSILYCWFRGQVQTAIDFTSPGWTRVGPDFAPSDIQRGVGWYMRPIVDVTAEPASYVFTRAAGGGRVAGAILAISGGALPSGQNPTYSGTGPTTGSPQNRDTATYAVKVVHGLQLYGVAAEHTSPNSEVAVSKPAGFTDRAFYVTPGGTGVSRTSIYVASRKTDTPASVASYSTAGQSMAAESITVSPPSPARFFTSVDDMLAHPGFTWAHRGNSQYFAEESAYSYRQALAHGYAVLELSMERTSDGVWVAIHDRDPNRTSGLAAGTQPNIAAMTWAQVNALQNTISVDGVDQPYMRVDAFITEFKDSGALFVLDPKYTWIDNIAYRAEFWNLCTSLGGPTKVIPKYFIDTVGIATESQARGYKAWGYAYAATLVDANFATWAGAPWGMLGMEVGATAGEWTTILGYSKPVVGHIALTQADYATAMTKGAVGVQVGGSQQVKAFNRLSP